MVEYFIKEVKGEYIVKEKNSNRVHSKFNSQKQALDKIKRLKDKDKISIKSKRDKETIPKDMSNPLPDSYEVKTILNEGLKDDTNIKKLKLKKKLRILKTFNYLFFYFATCKLAYVNTLLYLLKQLSV